MTVRRVLTFAITVALVGAAWATVGIQSSAASPETEADTTDTDTLAVMHAACVSNDVDAMLGAMESITDEDWDAMGSHMGSGMMDSGVMGSGVMGSGMMGSGVMGSGMMGSGSPETRTMDMQRW